MNARAAALAAACLLCASGCGRESTIRLPDPDAPPDVVLVTYLQALRAGDCPTAQSLVTSTFTIGNGELCGALDVVSFRQPSSPPSATHGDGDGEVVFSTVLTVRGGDVSMPDGEHVWFYVLRQQDDGEWRLVGGGSGP
jgi:hypothetical protein